MAKTDLPETKKDTSYKWNNALDKINKLVFKISTPNGSGTGFQIFHSAFKPFCGIATAYHVIAHQYEWEEPIKITHFESKKSVVFRSDQRALFVYPERDLAFILFDKGDLPVSTELPKLVPKDKFMKPGVEIGWCGFPAVAPSELCFFAGYVSCYLRSSFAYLVDGVAINGVSGGPAFYIPTGHNDFLIGGVVTAYLPNRATGETLPGVCFISSIKQFHDTLDEIKSFEEAKQKAEKQKNTVKNDSNLTTPVGPLK